MDESIPWLPAETARLDALRWTEDGRSGHQQEEVATEVPVALVYNGISHVVMLASPMDLEPFGVGFSLSEGIVEHASEIYDVDASATPDGIEIHMSIASERFMALKQRRRNLAGRTGCGLCGADSLRNAIRWLPPVREGARIRASALHRAFEMLHEQQPLHRRTGAMHACAWCEPDGRPIIAREDLGRHNALDKTIGAMALAGLAFDHGFAVVTSRASSEMVQKCIAVGIPLLAAISAPTELAVRMAQRSAVTLVGFARGGRHLTYSCPERILP